MNNNSNNNLDQLQATLLSWTGQEVLISKQENGDNDEVLMRLENVSVQNRQPTIDGYVSTVSLQLKGDGTILSGQEQVALPYSSYDIPIEQMYNSSVEDELVHFTTNRGEYTISRMQ